MTKKSEEIHASEFYTPRTLLALAGAIYFAWWFAVEQVLPNAFNPFLGRFVVVIIIFIVLLLSYLNDWVQQRLHVLFIGCTWLITLHYYYLFYENLADVNWIVGCYITVMAINIALTSTAALLSYSIFVAFLSLGLVFLVPTLTSSVFLPGLITILIQANMGLRSRLKVIKILSDSNARFQLLFNSTFEGVMVHDKVHILDVNESLGRMIEFSQAEILKMRPLDVIYPSERARVGEMMLLNDVGPYETKGYRMDGTAIDIEVRAKKFTYGNNQARLVTVHDISDRKRAEKEKIASLIMAENVRIRDEFISIASHELRTPISSLKLQTQLIEYHLKENNLKNISSEAIADYVALLHRQVNRLNDLIGTMLDVSRISAGKLILERQSVDFSVLVRDVVDSLQIQSSRAETPLVIEAPVNLTIYADRSRIAQIVENLLTNAIKYGDRKPVNVKVMADCDQAVLVVQDHGLGIATEYMERIFSRFERAISARNISGFGLGLYITKQIVDAHDGTITVDSSIGVGSTFTVRLPINPSMPL